MAEALEISGQITPELATDAIAKLESNPDGREVVTEKDRLAKAIGTELLGHANNLMNMKGEKGNMTFDVPGILPMDTLGIIAGLLGDELKQMETKTMNDVAKSRFDQAKRTLEAYQPVINRLQAVKENPVDRWT